MSYILKRNAEIYVSNVTSGFTSGNTDKVAVSDFSLTTDINVGEVNRTTIDPSESRSRRVYSQGDNPIDITYNSYLYAGSITSNVHLVDRKAFQGLAGYTGSYSSFTNRSEVAFTSSDIVNLLGTTVWAAFPNYTYRVNNVAFTGARISVDLNNIAQINWRGSGTSLTTSQSYAPPSATDMTVYKSCIINKLSTISLDIGATSYTTNLISADIDISNDVTFVARDILGEYTIITDHFTGDRSISGNLGFYLKSVGGSNDTADLFDFLYANKNDLENNLANITISIGGSTNTPRMDLVMPNVFLQLPNTSIDDVVSINTRFVAMESTPGAADELTIKYYL